MDREKRNRPGPPFQFVRRLLCRDEFADVESCFTEMYAQAAAARGAAYARRWIAWQALRSLPGFLCHLLYWKLLMLKNALEITLRNLLKNKGFFLIKVFGLAAGVACSMVVILYVTNELTYDTHHPDHERSFRIAQRRATELGEFASAVSPAPLATAMRGQISQVERVARVIPPYENAPHVLVVHGQKRFFEKRVWFVDPDIFAILRIPFHLGDRGSSLAGPNRVVISERVARTYFGDLSPLGRRLSIEIDYDTGAAVTEEFTVTGVVRDAPANTHLKYDLLLSMATLAAHAPTLEQDWSEFHPKYTYVKLVRAADPAALAEQLRPYSQRLEADFAKRTGSRMRRHEFFLQPLRSLHMGSNLLNEIEPAGNMTYVYIYSFAALLILLIGAINFVNLSATLSTTRTREVGIRKTLGGSRWDLIFQFSGESLIVTLFAFLAAGLMLSLLLGFFNRMAGTEIPVAALGQPQVLASLLGLFLLVGLSAGAYPALLLSRGKPLAALKEQAVPGSQGNAVQRLLVLAQFAISIFLVVCTLVVHRQLSFMKSSALGFSRGQKVLLEINSNQAHFRRNLEVIKRDFLAVPGVVGAAASSNVPGEEYTGGYYLQKGSAFAAANAKRLKVLAVDADFLRLYNIPPAAGRLFRSRTGNDAASAYIVNEAGARELGYTPESILGTTWTAHYHRRSKSIAGVTRNFHFLGLKETAEPLVLDLESSLLRVLTLELDSRRVATALAGVQKRWRAHFPEAPFAYTFLDEAFGRVYRYEERMGRLLGLISAMGIAIACLGLYGMVAFYTRRRRREIAVRRVLGASAVSIAWLLTRQFFSLVLLASVVAVPLSWLAASRWLQDFAYRIQPGFFVFSIAFAAALLIAMAAVLLQSLRAGRDNPAQALRCE